jgi:glycosyltransferase involved in cell wall biosynthesis
MSEVIKIGLDAQHIVSDSAGRGSYGRTLGSGLAANDDSLDLSFYAPDSGRDDLRQQIAEGDRARFCYPRGPQLLGKGYWQQHGIVSQLRRDGIQVYHGLSGELPKGLAKAGIRSVVTIHDLLFIHHPEYFSKAEVKRLTSMFHHVIAEADHIVAVSEEVLRDICRFGNIDDTRVSVVYPDCAPRFTTDIHCSRLWQVRDRYDLPDRYILSVGTINEQKNMLQAVKALHHLPDDVSLVIVGRATPYANEIWEYQHSNGLPTRVVMLHDVSDTHLPAIYRMAEAFVFPSRYEGFAMPVVEAIRTGLPVVACAGSSIEEIGGPHSLYVAPDDDVAMADAITKLLIGAPGRDACIKESQAFATRFSNGAASIADLYHQLATK